ncbi:hypothetical protein O3K00_21275, partial [Yersinia pestis]|nr:hypothetical protein [Yersinia pestis]
AGPLTSPPASASRVPLAAMRLVLALSVLVVALCMVLEGPAPAQAAPTQEALAAASTFEQIPDKLKEFGNTLEDKARAAIEHIKQSDFAAKTRTWFSEAFNKVKETFKDTFA